MPVNRGKKIVDARPQAVSDGVGSLPLTAATASASPRGPRRVTASGVEGIAAVGATATSSSDAIHQGPSAAPQPFRVPAAVLQRIQQQHHISTTASTVLAAEPAQETVKSPESEVAEEVPSEMTNVKTSTQSSHYHHRHQHQHSTSHVTASSGVPAPTAAPSHRTPHRAPIAKTAVGGTAATASEGPVEVEVSEADITATVAALKTVRAHHLEDANVSAAPAQRPFQLSSSQPNLKSASTDVATGTTTTTTDPTTTATAAGKAKPVIFSHQWRRQLFASAGNASNVLPLPAVKKAKAEGVTSAGADAAENQNQSEAEDRSSASEEDEEMSPFGKASVIKFGKSGADIRPFGGPPETRFVPSSSETDSVLHSDSDDDERNADASLQFPEGNEDMDGDNRNGNRQHNMAGQPSERRERHALRLQAAAAREKKRVRRHMSGFDKDFLRQQEAQLLHDAAAEVEGEEEEDEESDGSDYEEVEEQSGSDVYSEEGEEQDTEDSSESGEESEASDATSTRSGSSSRSAHTSETEDGGAANNASSDGEEENEEEKVGNTASTSSVSAAHHHHNGGGFGAMHRARLQQEKATFERQVRDPRSGTQTSKIAPDEGPSAPSPSSSPSFPLPPDATLSGAATRSRWFDSFFFAVHENRVRSGGCHHTLLGLRGPVSIHGPCGVIGFGLGEVCVSGFYLGKKQVNLWHEAHHAVLMPMRKLKTKHAQDMELPQWPHVPDPAWPPVLPRNPTSPTSPRSNSPRPVNSTAFHQNTKAGNNAYAKSDLLMGTPLNASHYTAASKHSADRSQLSRVNGVAGEGEEEEEESEENFLQSLQWNSEAVFGEVDWDWVETTVQSWRNLFSNKLPPILLVVQPSSAVARPRGVPGPMRKYYLSRKRGRVNGDKQKNNSSGLRSTGDAGADEAGAYMDIPSFVAHRRATSIDLALVPSIVPGVAAQGCGAVMVLGSANIGKSTLCRFLANTLLSQHGLCYWLDLDLGQPEFGVPGQLTLVQVRRPLLRERDERCVRTVAALFLGANTAVQCPLATANALATICAQAARVALDHPVVVNTHGWVLQTGRRVTVEALRRLRPRQVIHLYKEREEAWAQDTAALLDPRNGLNADVVQRRFLVRHAALGGDKGSERQGKTAAAATNAVTLLCRLPFPQALEATTATAAASNPESPVASSPTSPSSNSNTNNKNKNKKSTINNNSNSSNQRPAKDAAAAMPEWRGQVHAVCVEREETYATVQLLKATKGAKGRQQRWHSYFAPLLRLYAQRNAAGLNQERTRQHQQKPEEAETTLLEAPLSALCSIVFAERDEKAGDVALFSPEASTPPAPGTAGVVSPSQQTRAEVAAALEHAVVAVLFHRPGVSSLSAARAGGLSATTPTASKPPPSPPPAVGSGSNESNGVCVVRSLASLPYGFPVTCYGVVESSEQELRTGVRDDGKESSVAGGWIRLRVPLRPAVVAAMLAGSEMETATGEKLLRSAAPTLNAAQISIAYSSVLRQDTSFVDV